MTRIAKIQADYDADVEEAAERFGDHEDMSSGRVLKWLSQFEDEDLPLAAQIIRSVTYFNTINIRTMTSQLFDMVVSALTAKGLQRAAFVPVGNPGAGSGTVARVLRDAIRGTNHRMLSMLDVAKAQPGEFEAVVFIDDFSGTGKTLESWWETVEPAIRPTNADVFVGLLIVNAAARERVEEFAEIIAVRELDVMDNALASESTMFNGEQKPRIRDYCARTGVSDGFRAGYGGCALLLAFKHGCPNNSLPILWVKSTDWRPLFKRSAI